MAFAPLKALAVIGEFVAFGGRQMKRENHWALLTMVVATLAIVGTGFCLNPSSDMQYPTSSDSSRPVMRSIVKVHTNHGVITMPGNADSWPAAERAVFVADSIADVQIANSEVPWKISLQ
jgi:hypothetical protein